MDHNERGIFIMTALKQQKFSIAASNLQPGAHKVNTNMTTHYVFDYSQMSQSLIFLNKLALYILSPQEKITALV